MKHFRTLRSIEKSDWIDVAETVFCVGAFVCMLVGFTYFIHWLSGVMR